MFDGSIPALVTPFKDGAVDFGAFEKFVDWQIEQGSSALVPCGTTGESATMTIDEHNEVIASTVRETTSGTSRGDTSIDTDAGVASPGQLFVSVVRAGNNVGAKSVVIDDLTIIAG